MSVLNKPYFTDEAEAFKRLEAILWPHGPVCPHCGVLGEFYDLGKSRVGLKKCAVCRKQFTVRIGTVFEASHIPLHKWFQAVYLMSASKKGISAHQLHRTLEITYKSAWFMAHRVRAAMKIINPDPIGGEGKIVEADETFYGNRKGAKKARGGAMHKITVLALVERGGKIQSHQIGKFSKRGVQDVLTKQVRKESALMTDAARWYVKQNLGFAKHETVNHSIEEYVRGDVHTNTLEGYFSIFKRGMTGVYQHCSEKHLHRYLSEFDYRYNTRKVSDHERMEGALEGAAGKRLTYRRPD